MKIGDLNHKINKSINIRDIVTLISYLSAIIGFFSVVSYIHIYHLGFFLTLFLLSTYLEMKNRKTSKVNLPRWLLNMLSLIVVLTALFKIDRDNLVITIVETLLILLGIKLIEDKKSRDHLQIYIISIFLIAGSALLTLNISFLFYFVSFTFVFTAGIVMLTYLSESEDLEMKVDTITKILVRSIVFPLLAVPLSVIFFTILPRTNYPLLNFLNREIARSGFTDNMRLGKTAEIQEDSTIILRASMERIKDDQLYWRGIVFDYFDGSSWKAREWEEGISTSVGRGIKQTIYLEPYENRYLFGLDKPLYMSVKKAKVSKEFVFTLPKNISRRLKYEVYSALSEVIPEKVINRDRYLQLPVRDMEKLKNFAKVLKGKTDEDLARSIMDYLKKDYTYSLKALPESDHPIEDFLFRHKKGNCEYFASTMAVLLRLKGIPSRLVGGFRGGYYNEVGGYYIVSQRNAHVWVEVYINGYGWVRFDPTPATPRDTAAGRDIFLKARLMMDTINYYWNAFVINYDLSKQIALFNRMREIKMPHLRNCLKKGILIFIAVAITVLTIIVIARPVISFLKNPPEVIILKRFLKRMKKHGYVRRDFQGLEEFALMIKEQWLREKAFHFVREIEPYLFSSQYIDRKTRDRLMKIIKDIK